MKIEVKNEDMQRLAHLVYLGDIVVNGYRKTKEMLLEYEELAQDIYRQIVESIPELEFIYKFKHMPNKKSVEAKVADFTDRVNDATMEYYQEFLDHIIGDYVIRKV